MDWSYVAGFFDGEGSISRTRTSETIAICQKSRAVLDAIVEILHKEGVFRSRIEGRVIKNRLAPNGSPINYLKISNVYDGLIFLRGIRSYSIVKRTRISEAIDFLERKKDCTRGERLFSKELLNRLYWDEKKSICQIGNELGFSDSNVLRWMKKFRIPRRTRRIASELRNARDRETRKLVSEY